MTWQEIATILTGLGGLIAGAAAYWNGRRLPTETIQNWQKIASDATKDIMALGVRLDKQEARINRLVQINAYLRAHNLALTRQLLDADMMPTQVDPKQFGLDEDPGATYE